MKIDLYLQVKQQDRAHYDRLQLLRMNNLALTNDLITQEVKQKIEKKIWASQGIENN